MDSKTTLVLEMLKKHGVTLASCMTCVFRDDHGDLPKEFEGLPSYLRGEVRGKLWEIRMARMDKAFRELGINALDPEVEYLIREKCNTPKEFAEEVAKYLPS